MAIVLQPTLLATTRCCQLPLAAIITLYGGVTAVEVQVENSDSPLWVVQYHLGGCQRLSNDSLCLCFAINLVAVEVMVAGHLVQDL